MKGCALIFGKEAAPIGWNGSYADGKSVLESWERFGTGNPTFAEQNPHAEAFGTADGLFPYGIDHLFYSARALCGFPCEKPAPFCTQRVSWGLRYRKYPLFCTGGDFDSLRYRKRPSVVRAGRARSEALVDGRARERGVDYGSACGVRLWMVGCQRRCARAISREC